MNGLKASKITAMVALMLAFLMLGAPAAVFGIEGADIAKNASAAKDPSERMYFKLGVVDMTVSTLNPNTYTMSAEGMIIFPLYSYLIQWDQSGEKVIGDLAKDWWVSPDGLTWEFDLVDTAYWVYYDNDLEEVIKGPKVTAEDVRWSVETLADADQSRLQTIWPEGIIDEVWTEGDYHFGIRITEPFVPMQDSLMTQLIFPKYIWENENFITYDNIPTVSSGAFIYKTNGLPDTGYAELMRNPYWHGEESYGWQVHCDEFVMCRYDDSGTCWSALVDGEIDGMIGVQPSDFVNALPLEPQLTGFHQSNGFVYEFNLNQLSDANRKLIGGSLNAGSNSQLLLNDTIKTAISMSVDRDNIIEDALFGYGEWTTTLVPSQNPMSHSYGTDGHVCIEDPVRDLNNEPDPVDREAAKLMLWEQGWRYDAAGTYYDISNTAQKEAFMTVCPLYNGSLSDPDRESLSFRFYTLKPVTTWQDIGTKLVSWAAEIGVEFVMELKSVNEMNTIWYAADYDVWLWDWVFTPYTEAASGVLVVLTTGAIGTDSDVYWSDPEFDSLYEQAIREMDFEKRKEILYDMQDMVYLNRGCQALAFREDMYAFNTNGWNDFGDLNNEYYLLPDVWPVWLSMQMNPVYNDAPQIGGILTTNNSDSGLAEVGVPVSFSALGITDDGEDIADLNYTWIFGFGGEKEWDVGDEFDYQFDSDGVYTVTLVVKETVPKDGYDDYLSSYYTLDLTVYDMSNQAPHDLAIEMSPEDPTAGEVVTFTGSAIDDEGDDLYYTWDFGDGSVLTGDVVEHQFEEVDSYTVTLSVDDHRFGAVDRPIETSQLVVVGQNHAPTITVPDYGSVTVKATETYTVQAGDQDSRDSLVFTWDWGDGSSSVTSTPSTTHVYNYKGTYTVTVYADDQTGLSGHNVSDSSLVYVLQTGNKIPVIAEFTVSSSSAFVEQYVTFYASAADGDGDPLTFEYDFGDGTTDTDEKAGTDPLEIVESSSDKAYSAAGTYSVYLTVTDGTGWATSSEIVMTIEDNAAPVIEEFAPAAYFDTGVAMTFSVVAVDDDGDSLTYSWEWGDGTTSETTVGTTTHTFAESGTYTVTVMVDDGKGLGDMADADVTVNAVPYIDPPLSARTLNQNQEYTFSVSAFDDDMDSLYAMWDFGDGSAYEFGTTVTHTYDTLGTYTRTVYVWDEFVEYRTSHNVSSSASVLVKDPSVDSPPDVDPLDDIYAVVGEEVTIEVYATDDNDEVLTYTWDFGDASDLFVGAPPVAHTYATDGEYTLTVWVADQSGLPTNNVSVTATVYVGADMPPVADAGGDRTVDEDATVPFTGEASTDEFPIPEDGYAWTVNDYDGAHEFSTMTFDYVFEMPGVYSVELVVTDSIGQESDADVISVTVLDITAPEVNAGEDQTVHNGTLVTFDGSATDNYDETLSFEWRFIYDDVLQTLTGESPTFTFDIMAVYTVTLTVEDDAGNSAEDDVRITVTDLVDPVANAGADQTVDEGAMVTFDGSGSSDDDSAITLTWEFVYDGATETLSGESPTFEFAIAGVYVVTLTVEDEAGNSATDTVTITVVAATVNAAPSADAGADATIDVGTEHTFDGSASSDDVLVTNYTWTFTYDGEEKVLWGVSPSFTFDIAGVYVVTLTVSDAESLTDTDTVMITVETSGTANVAPVADAGDDDTYTVGATVTFDGSGSTDSDGSIASYVWTFDYDGESKVLTGVSPTFVFEIEGTYTVTLTVTDDDGDTDTDTVSITVEADSEPDEKSFLATYGLPIAAILVLLVVAVVAMLFMKKGKGGKSMGAEPATPEEPAPPEDQNL